MNSVKSATSDGSDKSNATAKTGNKSKKNATYSSIAS